jgi:biotin carboxylase
MITEIWTFFYYLGVTMVALILGARPQNTKTFLREIEGPAHCLIPVGTELLWRSAGVDVPLHPVADWHDYRALAEVVAGLPVTRVIGAEEPTIAAAGYLRSLLGVPGQGFDQALAFTDKATMKSRLHAAGIPVARWAVVRTFAEAEAAADEIGWPVVIKGRRGFGVLGVTRVYSAHHLHELVVAGRFERRVPNGDAALMLQKSGIYDGLLESPDGFMVERCIDVAEEYSCDIVVWRGEPYLTLTTRYLMPLLAALDSGTDIRVAAIPEDDRASGPVRALTLRAIEALGLSDGQVHCEIFRTRSDGYVLGEIACRAGGAMLPVLSEILFGINTAAAGVDITLDREPPRAGMRAYRSVAVVAVPLASGTVRQAPTRAELERLPGVLRADVRAHVGDVYGGGLGSTAAAAHLFIEVNPDDPFGDHMERLRAMAEPLFVIENTEQLATL